jgi:membrane-bound lytic murein transglycosylase B
MGATRHPCRDLGAGIELRARRNPEPAIRTLATHAFMSRRKDFFHSRTDRGAPDRSGRRYFGCQDEELWAGALGQPLFLPSYYLKYAVDGDGDGDRDIWGSPPDVLASIANFLRNEGWDPDRGWGIEATVPTRSPPPRGAGAGPRHGRMARRRRAAGRRTSPAPGRAESHRLTAHAGWEP